MQQATLTEPMEEPAAWKLSLELQLEIAHLAIGHRCRELSRDHRDAADALANSICFTPSTPVAEILRRLTKMPQLRTVSLRHHAALTDTMLQTIIAQQRSAELRYDVSGCWHLAGQWRPGSGGSQIIATLADSWWLHGPSPHMSPLVTIALQLYALKWLYNKYGAQEHWPELGKVMAVATRALRVCFAFCAHIWDSDSFLEFAEMTRSSYRPMMHAQQVEVSADPTHTVKDSHRDPALGRALVYTVKVVSHEDTHVDDAMEASSHHVYAWHVSKCGDGAYAGCWMSDGVLRLQSDQTWIQVPYVAVDDVIREQCSASVEAKVDESRL